MSGIIDPRKEPWRLGGDAIDPSRLPGRRKAGDAMSPSTEAGRRLLDEWYGSMDLPGKAALVAAIAAIEAEARAALLAELGAEIFDLPIGENVHYSRGYSAAIAVVRDLIRKAGKP